MGSRVINLFVLAAGGVMLANIIAHPAGTAAFFNGIGGLWKTSVNGMLGSTTK